MVNLVENTSTSFDAAEGERLTLRFPRVVWNAHTPEPSNNTNLPSIRTTASKRKTAGKPCKFEKEPAPKVLKRSSLIPRQCKVKIWRFQYGGPGARMGGKSEGLVTLEAPCLRDTCANCLRWHARLMCGPLGAETSHEEEAGIDPAASLPAPDLQVVDDEHRRRRSHLKTVTETSSFIVALASSRDPTEGSASRKLCAPHRRSIGAAGLLPLRRRSLALQMMASATDETRQRRRQNPKFR